MRYFWLCFLLSLPAIRTQIPSNKSIDFDWHFDETPEPTNNRSKRLVNLGLKLGIGKIKLNVNLNLLDFWSNKHITKAKDPLPKPSREYFSRGGVQTVTDARLYAQFNAEPSPMEFADLTADPWRHYGKLFYKTPQGFGCCSAAFVDRNILLTAAHCVKTPAGWYRNFLFFHRYNTIVDKGRPIAVGKIFVPTQYDRDLGVGYGDIRYDYAFIITEVPSDSGYLPTAFGQLSNAIVSSGYPKNAYCGEKLVYSQGGKGLEDNFFVNFPSNPMQEGCSGGPWLARDSKGNFVVIGLNSHHRIGISGIFSPRFNGLTAAVFNAAKAEVSQQQQQQQPQML